MRTRSYAWGCSHTTHTAGQKKHLEACLPGSPGANGLSPSINTPVQDGSAQFAKDSPNCTSLVIVHGVLFLKTIVDGSQGNTHDKDGHHPLGMQS
jgi:hypothetical protein